jgi:polysaccharide pyruvyl transferase WcaK-like protein
MDSILLMKKTILVYGWYNQKNIGDDLFAEAFVKLWDYQFVFVDKITIESLQNASAVFIGGGSFLYAAPKMENKVLELLKQKKIFYIGVGAETEIHEIHCELIRLAQLIAIRTPQHVEKIKSLNDKVIVIPDIVYSLQPHIIKSDPVPKSILVIPNLTVVPQGQDPHWKHAAWTYFKSEFAQFLDALIEQKYTLNFFAMCQNDKINDHWASIEILNSMKFRNSKYIMSSMPQGIEDISATISPYNYIITQRFHGIVLSEMLRIPYVAIHHHDKLKNVSPGEGSFLSYYGISKQKLNEEFNLAKEKNFSTVLPIEINIFDELKQTVVSCLNDG